MKVKMKVLFQNTSGVFYEEGKEYEVGAQMGAWLIKARKAVEVVQAGSIHDVEPQFENANEPPKPPVKKARRVRGAK